MADRELGTGSGTTPYQSYLNVTLSVLANENPTFQFDRMHNQYSPFERRPITLTQGANNTITPNTKAAGVVIVPPSTNTQAYIVKGIAGDTGLNFGTKGIAVIPLNNPPQTNFVINLAAGTDQEFVFFYW